jgi:uncharacterized protein
MYRLLIILFFFTALLGTSYGQKPKEKRSKENIKTKTVDSIANPLQDTAFLNQFEKEYRDSVLIFVDSLLNDTTFLNSIVDSSVSGYGEFASSQYKFRVPLKAIGWINDFEHILTSGQIDELDSIIDHFEKETTNEIAIVTIDSSWTTRERFDSFTLDIARKWGIGKKDKKNGILIGISKGLRIIQIQNGYGIEAKLSDAETKKIIDDFILPDFRNANYFEGIKSGLLALMQKIR